MLDFVDPGAGVLCLTISSKLSSSSEPGVVSSDQLVPGSSCGDVVVDIISPALRLCHAPRGRGRCAVPRVAACGAANSIYASTTKVDVHCNSQMIGDTGRLSIQDCLLIMLICYHTESSPSSPRNVQKWEVRGSAEPSRYRKSAVELMRK